MAVAGAADLVLLGHHRRDQAETFLLQALRGGGVAALAGMPKSARREGVTWARPWLDLSREAIEAYARAHRLRWIDDDSNDDVRFARNRLRHDVWPALTASFGDAEASLATAARHVAQAAALIDEVAAADVSTIAGDGRLDLVAWRALSIARQRAALRHWLRRVTGVAAPASLVERLMDEARVDGTRRWPAADGELHSYRGRLGFETSAPVLVDDGPRSIDLGRAGMHVLDRWGGAMRVDVVDRGGIDIARAARLAVRARRPGDRFQAGPRRPPRSLKLQFQQAGLSTSDRAGPVLCDGETLVFVAGLGIDARAVAAIGDAQVSLTWLPLGGASRRGRWLESHSLGARRAAMARITRASRRALPMALIVHKYGGTSMGSPERIQSVARRVAKWVAGGASARRRAVGHERRDQSPARAGASQLAPASTTRESLRELDMIASTGEQVSVGLLALALQAEGMPAVSYAGWQVPITTDSAYTKARIESIDDQRIRADLAAGKVVVVTGFQGVDPDGPHHHARARRLRHLGGGHRRRAEGRRVPDLHRRRRRLHHRPAHRRRRAAALDHQLRGNARDGEPRFEGAADPLGRVRRQVPRAAARAVELHAVGHRHRRGSPLRAP